MHFSAATAITAVLLQLLLFVIVRCVFIIIQSVHYSYAWFE